jgi:transmembrane sensor
MNYPMSDEYRIIGKIMATYPDISEEDRQILNEWMMKAGNKELFNSITNNNARAQDLKRFLEIKDQTGSAKERFQRLLSEPEIKRKVAWWMWPSYFAAASVIFLVCLIGYRWYKGQDDNSMEEKPVIAKVYDVPPGKFKAKLTLADGSVMVIDSFYNGQLVQQPGANVLNKDGKLVYKSAGKSENISYNTLITSKGEMYGMILSDGSKVWLNSQSSIRYPVSFNGDVRKVEITGEAYFEVASIFLKEVKKVPFIVSLNDMEVEVLGTKFNINSYADEDAVITTLIEGKVNVRSISKSADAILQTGEQAILRQGQDDKIKVIENADVEEAIAWHIGYFQFNNADLKTVLKQLVRWYEVEVVYQGNIPQREFWGKISKKNTLSQVLATLESNNIHFKLEGKRIIVSP